MTTRRQFLRMIAAGSVGMAAVGSWAKEAPVEKRKINILFLMTDQHRADCLGCDGNPVIKTPNFDRLASEGVRFSHAYSSTPTCTPARACILTGQSPWNHGMIAYGKVAERYPVEMPRMMADAGYYTFAIGKLHYHPQRNYHGFHGALIDESGRVESLGFESDYRKGFRKQAPDKDPDATGIGWNEYQSGNYVLPEELHPTHWTGEMAADYIKKYDRDEPFFLKVSFARPHSPYDPPSRFWEMYEEKDIPAPQVGKWAKKYAPIEDESDKSLWHGDLGTAQVKKSRHGYYGSVTFIDEQIGKILKALEDKGLLENTFILFTSDHGDMLGDHNLWRKSYAYEGSARVPMLIRWPESMELKAERGKTIAQPVELRDVFPTFLDIAGSKVPESVDGDSLLKLLRGEAGDWREYIDLEHGVCYSEENHWNALTDGKWKYIYHAFDGSEQLFHLENDPGELNDLAQDESHSETLKLWRERMIKHLSERGEEWVKDGKLTLRSKKVIYSPKYPWERR